MTKTGMTIRPYLPEDENVVIELWRKCNLVRPWNDPKRDIERKLKVNPELFFVGLIENKIVATAMAGYEGHRGWVNYLAVDLDYHGRTLGQQIMETIENKLLAVGCPKINILIRADNKEAVKFYKSIGYKTEEIVIMGKRLVTDEPENE